MLEIPTEKLKVNWSDAIGAGSFGRVFRGTWLGTDIAVKQIRRGASVKESILREATIHSMLQHPNIVTFLGISTKKKDILIVTEFVKGKSLQVHIDEETVIADAVKTELINDILRGIAYLHEVGVVHGDVKPGNILVTSSLGTAKICDFGLGRLKQHASLPVASLSLGDNVIEGTPSYMAPECLLHKARASYSSDVWALGVTLLEFLTFQDPWERALEGQDGDTEIEKLVAAQKASSLPVSLVQSLCLKYNKELRQTAITLIDCEW